MKTFVGKVVRAKTPKTVHVEITRLWMHPMYRKKVKRTNVFACQDDIGVHEGDQVVIGETRPLSATKRFKIVELVKRGSILVAELEEKPKKQVRKKKEDQPVEVTQEKQEKEPVVSKRKKKE